jgi:hypothetical protein
MASVPIGNPSSPAPLTPIAQPHSPASAQQQGAQERLPPAISPDQILDYAPRKARVVRVDANTIAYFGDLFHAMRQSLFIGAPGMSARKVPASTASSQNRS